MKTLGMPLNNSAMSLLAIVFCVLVVQPADAHPKHDFSKFEALYAADLEARGQAWIDTGSATNAWLTWYKPSAIVTEVFYDGENKSYLIAPIAELLKLFEDIVVTDYKFDTRVIRRIKNKGRDLVHIAGYARYTIDAGLDYPLYLHETYSATGTFNLSGTPGAGVVNTDGTVVEGRPVFQAVMEDIFIEQTADETAPFAIIDMQESPEE